MCKTSLNYKPVNSNTPMTDVDLAMRIHEAETHFSKFLNALGLDQNDPNLSGTANRVARMYMNELFVGTHMPKPEITTFDLPKQTIANGMIISGPLSVKSICAHHFMPIVGNCWIGILLGKSNKNGLPGLSKYKRVLDYYARRPQLQEQLTLQVHDHLVQELNITDKDAGVYVVIKAEHGCMTMRGVNETNSIMTTAEPSGAFMNQAVRSEFLTLAGIK